MIEGSKYEPRGSVTSVRKCPNCGDNLEAFSNATRHDVHEGYRCENCEVEWSLDEWERGVEKRPDPDEEHQVQPLERRLIGHAHADIMRAIDNGTFAVETPRVHVEKDTFSDIMWAIQRDTQNHYSTEGLCGVTASAPYLVLEIEWVMEENQHYVLPRDFDRHLTLEGPVVLYGDMHLWQMGRQRGDVETWHDIKDQEDTAEARLEWERVEEVGWR